MASIHALGFVVRLAYFMIAPFMLTVAASVMPMTGVLLNIVLVLVSFVVIETLRASAERRPLLQKLLKKQFAFEAYYRENPPRTFLYYVVYPLLAPYWLSNRVARRELTLYRGLSGLSLVLLVGLGALDYATHWAPEIAFGTFMVTMIAMFIIQLIMIMTFVIPLSVTLVSYQMAGRKRAIWALLGAALLSILFAFLGMSRMRGHVVPVEVQMRAAARTTAAPERAVAAQDAALHGVWAELRAGTAELDADGWITGDTLVRAREKLAAVYRPEEAEAFTFHVWPVQAPTHAMLQLHRSRKEPVWRALDSGGHALADASAIPADLWNARPTHMRKSTRR